MKDTFYFSHDCNARNDSKITDVIMDHWMEWVWIFWCIVEMLYEEWWYLQIRYDRISFELRTSKEKVKSIIEDYKLFENDWDKFWSNSIIDRLKQRMDKSEKARLSVQKRWDDKKTKDTNVLQTNNDSNTIKERKGKEIKEKKRKETVIVATQPNEYEEWMNYLKNFSIKSLIPDYAEEYRDEWIKFCYYWSEKWRNWKIRAEGEKTFEIKRRFATWMSRKKETYQKIEKPSVMDITL